MARAKSKDPQNSAERGGDHIKLPWINIRRLVRSHVNIHYDLSPLVRKLWFMLLLHWIWIIRIPVCFQQCVQIQLSQLCNQMTTTTAARLCGGILECPGQQKAHQTNNVYYSLNVKLFVAKLNPRVLRPPDPAEMSFRPAQTNGSSLFITMLFFSQLKPCRRLPSAVVFVVG